jgi:hypothetical protein
LADSNRQQLPLDRYCTSRSHHALVTLVFALKPTTGRLYIGFLGPDQEVPSRASQASQAAETFTMAQLQPAVHAPESRRDDHMHTVRRRTLQQIAADLRLHPQQGTDDAQVSSTPAGLQTTKL